MAENPASFPIYRYGRTADREAIQKSFHMLVHGSERYLADCMVRAGESGAYSVIYNGA